jgi:hypothetical protein
LPDTIAEAFPYYRSLTGRHHRRDACRRYRRALALREACICSRENSAVSSPAFSRTRTPPAACWTAGRQRPQAKCRSGARAALSRSHTAACASVSRWTACSVSARSSCRGRGFSARDRVGQAIFKRNRLSQLSRPVRRAAGGRNARVLRVPCHCNACRPGTERQAAHDPPRAPRTALAAADAVATGAILAPINVVPVPSGAEVKLAVSL